MNLSGQVVLFVEMIGAQIYMFWCDDTPFSELFLSKVCLHSNIMDLVNVPFITTCIMINNYVTH